MRYIYLYRRLIIILVLFFVCFSCCTGQSKAVYPKTTQPLKFFLVVYPCYSQILANISERYTPGAANPLPNPPNQNQTTLERAILWLIPICICVIVSSWVFYLAHIIRPVVIMQTQIKAMQVQIVDLQTEVRSIQGQIVEIKTQMSVIQTQVESRVECANCLHTRNYSINKNRTSRQKQFLSSYRVKIGKKAQPKAHIPNDKIPKK